MVTVPDLDDSVHIWRISLTSVPVEPESHLSPSEHERANRFQFARDRNRFVAAHSALRQRLADYAGCAPGQLTFGYTNHDKP